MDATQRRRAPWGARLCDRILFPAAGTYLDSTSDLRLDLHRSRSRVPTCARAASTAATRPVEAIVSGQTGVGLTSVVAGDSSDSSDGEDYHDADDGFSHSTRGLTRSEAAALARLHRDIRRLPPERRLPLMAHAATDLDLLRFLRVHGFDATRALSALSACVDWRARTPEVADPGWARHSAIMSLGMSIVYGTDREGHPLWIVRPELHSPRNSEACISCTFTLIEHIIGIMKPGVYRCTVVFDMKGFGFANYDVRWALTCISALRNYYPERLAKAIVTSAPLAFRALWKAIQPFMDAAMIARVLILNDDYMHQLHQLIDPRFLPQRLGGTLRVCNKTYGRVLCAGGTQERAEHAALTEGERHTVTV